MPKLIIGFVADLMFQTRVESAALKLDYQTRWIESAEQVQIPAKARSPLDEQEILGDQLSVLAPSLLIFDLGNAQIPWNSWIPALKLIPETRNISILCFGSHVDVASLKKARQCGADEVVARSRFVTALPELIQKYAR